MIAANLKPKIIYRENLHRPRIPDNIDKIRNSVNNSLSEAVTVLGQKADIMNSANEKSNEDIQNIYASFERISEDIANINKKLDSLDKLDKLSEKMDAILNKLAEFDVQEDSATQDVEITSNEDTAENKNESEEIPKDWISDEEIGDSDGD